jgi:hypothetical protein
MILEIFIQIYRDFTTNQKFEGQDPHLALLGSAPDYASLRIDG